MLRSTRLRAYLKEFRKDELSQLVIALTGETRAGKKDDLVELALASGSPRRVEQIASRIEAITTFKHSWAFTLGEPWRRGLSQSVVSAWAHKLFPDLFKLLADLDTQSSELQPTLQLYDEQLNRVYLKCTQWITRKRYVDESPTTKVLKVEQVRHPVVIVIRGDLAVLEVRFNGFTQGQAIASGERLPYVEVAEAARELVHRKLGIAVTGFGPGRAIQTLLSEMPKQLSFRGMAGRDALGSLSVRSQESGDEGTVAAVLTSFLGIDVSESQLRAAMQDAPADAVWLGWLEHGVVTRVSNQRGYTEILFIWRGKRDNRIVDRIISRVVEAHAATPPVRDYESVRRHITELKSGATFLLSDLAKRFGLGVDWLVPIVEAAREDHLIERRFRVRTDKMLLDFVNKWQSDLGGLPRVVVDEDGTEIRLDDPANIEVGYCRL